MGIDRDKFARALCWTMYPCSSMVAEIMDCRPDTFYSMKRYETTAQIRDNILSAADHMIDLLEKGELNSE